MKKRFWIISLAAVFIFSSMLIGCVEKKSATSGKTLVYGRGADSKLLDPIQVTDGESFKPTDQIFDTLVEYDKKTTEVVPGLAESWETSEDDLTWTFKLRKNIQFHDGTPFNAEAVVYNFERWMDPDHPEHKGGEFPYYGYMFGGFKGDEGHVIESVTALDENTVQFKLKKPLGPFLSNLAMSPFGIASPAAVKKDPVKFVQNPVGTGPFQFESWKKNDSVVLVKNKNFWKKGLPQLDRVIFKSIPDNAARYSALQSGGIDMMDGLNPNDVNLIKQDSQFKLYEQPGMNVGYLAFNTGKKPLDNSKVRQAMNHAVNKEAIIKNFYAGQAIPAVNPIPPMMWSYNKQVQDYPYDLNKAKQLLKEAGYPDGFEIEFYAMTEPRPYMPNGKKIAEFIQADLAKIGIRAKIVTYDWQTYLDLTGKGEHQMALMGWNGDNGDPDNFLYVLLDKDNTRMPDAGNIAFYKSDKVHDLLISAQSITDQEERTKLYQEAQELIKNDAPWVPIAHATVTYAARKDITGFAPHPTTQLIMEDLNIKE